METRQLTLQDVAAALRIQQEAYPATMLETAETFEGKINTFPSGCLGCWKQRKLVGYVFSHPWWPSSIVPLNFNLERLPPVPSCFYIHDLAVASLSRKAGIARRLLAQVFQVAEQMGIASFTLVAVQSSEAFWERHGFKKFERIAYAPGVPGTIMTRSVLTDPEKVAAHIAPSR